MISLSVVIGHIHLNLDKCKEAAKTDPSFDKVREDERFNQLIN
ncbi:MAG TPA: hypothetical protein V6D35_05140 [Candidatus Sericytochromatia bacterium]